METFVTYNTEINPVKRLDFNFWSPRDNHKIDSDIEIRRLADWVGNGSITTSAFYPAITPYYRKKDDNPDILPFIRVDDTRKLLLEYDHTVFLDRDLLQSLSKNIKIVHPNDLVITKGGEYVGEAALVPHYYNEYAICRDILAIYTERCPFSGKYLCSYFQSQIGKRELLRTKSVQGQPHLTLEKVSEIDIPYFGEDFENEINEYWDSFYLLISDSNHNLNNATTLLNEFLKGLFEVEEQFHVFIKEVTNQDVCQRIDVEFYQQQWSNLVNDLKSEGIKFEHVKTKKQPIDLSDPQLLYKYITLSDIDYRSGIIKNYNELPAHALPDRAKRAVSFNDILVSSLKGSRDKISIVDNYSNNLVASTGFYIVTSEFLKPEVLYTIFRSNYYNLFIEQMASGAIMSSITDKYFKQLELPIVNDEIQSLIIPEIQAYLEKRALAFDILEQATSKFDEELLD